MIVEWAPACHATAEIHIPCRISILLLVTCPYPFLILDDILVVFIFYSMQYIDKYYF
ncbi:MAG: hypothetical protein AABY49_07935 [Planctomycetota bacterium]